MILDSGVFVVVIIQPLTLEHFLCLFPVDESNLLFSHTIAPLVYYFHTVLLHIKYLVNSTLTDNLNRYTNTGSILFKTISLLYFQTNLTQILSLSSPCLIIYIFWDSSSKQCLFSFIYATIDRTIHPGSLYTNPNTHTKIFTLFIQKTILTKLSSIFDYFLRLFLTTSSQDPIRSPLYIMHSRL